MPDQGTVFTTPVTDPVTPTPTPLIGEGGKYATEADAIASIQPAQEHISTIEAENAALKQQLEDASTNATSMDTILEALKPQSTAPSEPATTGIPEEASLSDLIDKAFDARSSKDRQQANVNAADKAAREAFGEKASEVVAAKADELGLSVEFLMNVAATSPSAFIKLVSGIDTPTTPDVGATSTTSTISTENLVQHGSVKNAAYYSKMRVDDPQQFKSVAVQQEMMRSRGALGDKYFN